MTELHLWLRHEVRSTERRTPVVPSDARRLVDSGVTLTVEESPQRIFPIEQYEAVGCEVAPAGSWASRAPEDAVVVGLKELPDGPAALPHRHVFFGHAYKEQPGAAELLRRFAAGGGALLDLEYLADDHGRRLAAFGYWAGYLGAALAVLQHRGRLSAPLTPTSQEELEEALRPVAGDEEFTALVIGALGRSGRGARVALQAAGCRAHLLGPRRDPRPGPPRPARPRRAGELRPRHQPDPALRPRERPGRPLPCGCAPSPTSPVTSARR